jgi:hypothetical protein
VQKASREAFLLFFLRRAAVNGTDHRAGGDILAAFLFAGGKSVRWKQGT